MGRGDGCELKKTKRSLHAKKFYWWQLENAW